MAGRARGDNKRGILIFRALAIAGLQDDGAAFGAVEAYPRTVIRQPIRDKADGFGATSGVIILRPQRKPGRMLVESFAALRGLDIVHRASS